MNALKLKEIACMVGGKAVGDDCNLSCHGKARMIIDQVEELAGIADPSILARNANLLSSVDWGEALRVLLSGGKQTLLVLLSGGRKTLLCWKS